MKIRNFKLEYFVAIILLLVLISKIQLIKMFDLKFSFHNLIVICFFLFSIFGIIGIYLNKQWGYFSIYLFILISSLALGVAPIPFIVSLFPIQTATLIVILSSVILFLFTLMLQLKNTKSLKIIKTT